jgi:hypothetical protein
MEIKVVSSGWRRCGAVYTVQLSFDYKGLQPGMAAQSNSIKKIDNCTFKPGKTLISPLDRISSSTCLDRCRRCLMSVHKKYVFLIPNTPAIKILANTRPPV